MLKLGSCKPFTSIEDQLNLLESRGLIITDREFASSILKRINYYRFSAYTLTLKLGDSFYPNVSFEDVYELYRCDEVFRKIILKYTTQIEIAFRAYVSYTHTENHGPLGYMDNSTFDDPYYHALMIKKLGDEANRSDDQFIEHHKRDCGSVFPLWVLTEITTFGELSKIYKNMLPKERTVIAKKYCHVHRKYIENWLQGCSVARNIAAHNGRFYNRKLQSVKIRLNKSASSQFDNNSPFAVLWAMYRLLFSEDIKQQLIEDLSTMFESFPFALKEHYGFPTDWDSIIQS